jgi:hypothetical protein
MPVDLKTNQDARWIVHLGPGGLPDEIPAVLG